MASALLHMNCPPLRNDIIGMESNSFNNNDTLEGLDSVKRDQDFEELERGQVKKRRKQSKPNRIASTEVFSEIDVRSAVWLSLQQNQNAIEPDRLSNQTFFSESREEEITRLQQKQVSDQEITSQDDGSPAYNNPHLKKELSFPLNLSHKSPSPQESIDSFSSTIDDRNWFKSTENASLLYNMHNSDPINLKNHSFQNNIFHQSQACNLILPSFKRILVGNNENQIASPHRIFNPEAFCDLCNKEFCNKYFLKTHKANKHGIYMENIGPNPIENLSTLPLMNYFSSSITNLSSPTTQQTTAKRPTPAYSSNSNKSNSSMRAFCNICQREFCNKYFVRRHKAKIHGIIESNGDMDCKQQITNEKIESLDSNLPGPSAIKINKDFQCTKESNEVVLEIERTIIKKEENDSEETNSPHDALSMLVSTWQNEDSKECSKSPDRNKKQSNSNSSAFCDICCKEYCNKYFLRVHKQKCHGIPFPEKDEKHKENNVAQCKSSQPMPLNLILRENNKNIAESDGSNACNMCNTSFSDNYSLKQHIDHVHTSEKILEKPTCNSNINFPSLEHQPSKHNLDIGISRPIETPNNLILTQENSISLQKNNQGSDIQKMNSMLLKFNQHVPFDNYMCDVCNQDYTSMSSLENHIIRDHASLIEEISNSFYEENQAFQTSYYNKLECTKCQKVFSSLNLLEQHFAEKHSLGEPKNNDKILNENQDLTSHISVPSERQIVHTPTSSFCEICKKELCNKYFMKTHMQRMHGISIENGAHIGGVVCDICNKELCSKYFLRVHKQNSHGIVEEAFLPQIGAEIKVPITNADAALRPSDNELSHRYFSHFTEVCTICSRRFRSTKWLRAHLLNDHGEEGKDKWREVQLQNGNKNIERALPEGIKKSEPYYPLHPKNFTADLPPNDSVPSTSDQNNELPSFFNRTTSKSYQCSYCPFSSTILSMLSVHERSHMTDIHDLRCPLCAIHFESNEALEKHLTLKHSTLPFPQSKNSDDLTQFRDSAHIFQYDETDNKREFTANKDNNYEEVNDSKLAVSPSADACLKCNKCSYVTHHIELYSEHIKNEHKIDEPHMDYLQIIRDALLQIANNSHIPASFAVPNNLGNFMMQPFVLEDKAFGANPASSAFLSSLVFLPVKERLNKPITASFKLTPT